MNNEVLNTTKKVNLDSNLSLSLAHPSDSLKEYMGIIRYNLFPIILIFVASILATILYVSNTIDYFRTSASVKVNKPQGNILTAQFLPNDVENFQSVRYIANEIEVMKSFSIREKVALALIDSVKADNDKSRYFYLINRAQDAKTEILPAPTIISYLGSIVGIVQKRGLDIVDITVESPAKYEAKLIADVFAKIYVNYSLDYSRREATTIRKFFEEEKQKWEKDLANAESALQDFEERSGLVSMESKTTDIVSKISNAEAEKNTYEIEITSAQRTYNDLKEELGKADKSILEYFNGTMNQPYLTELQTKIASLEVQRDLDATIPADENLKAKVIAGYDKKIAPLKKSLDEKIEIARAGIFANTPEDRRNIVNKLFESDILLQSNKAKLNSVKSLLAKYDGEFSRLPSQTIELARLERTRKSSEKVFTTLEEKFQEALANERSQLGNVYIIDNALMPGAPSKPNRKLIVMAGSLLGLALGIGFAFLRNYLDRSIKTPEDIENKGISVLAWIPSIEELKELGSSQLEFVIANKPKSSASESFKALRTRVQFSKLESEPLKTILITSSIPAEGKTTVALNLAGSFAQSDKKTLLLDCDLRKPRLHAIFESERFPGLSDYLFSNANFEEVIRKTKLSNLDYITSGTIPPNPSELLGSNQMKKFIESLKEIYDIIVIDSPPYISVTDAEILSRITDGTILVVQANKTPIDAFLRTYERVVSYDEHRFLGTVLNNFMIRSAYGYYYNYYYYYSKPETTKTIKPKNLT